MIVHHHKAANSDKLALCSREAAIAYPTMLGCVDDWGRAELNPRKILGQLFPRRRDVFEGNVRRWLDEYARVRSPLEPQGHGLIRTYQVGTVVYFEFTKWKGVPPSRRKFMKVPPPPWAPADQHARWRAEGGEQLDLEGTSPGPLPDLSPTSPNGALDGSKRSGDSRFPSVPSVPAVTDPPLTPPAVAGVAGVDLSRLPEQLRRMLEGYDTANVTDKLVTEAVVEFIAATVKRYGPFASRRARRGYRNAYRAGHTVEAILDAELAWIFELRRREGTIQWDEPTPRAADVLLDRPPPAAGDAS